MRIDQRESRTRGLEHELVDAEAKRAAASEFLAKLRRRIALNKATLGRAHPDETRSPEERELHAPWLNEELDTARSDLFLAALQLHQDFLANTAAKLSHWLRSALEVVAGTSPYVLEPEKRLAAWQLFFLVVPLISTTFASFGRMFGNIGPESIGWVFIDEAGQASPQHAAGAVWRAQRAIAVGDPLQLQPIVTIP